MEKETRLYLEIPCICNFDEPEDPETMLDYRISADCPKHGHYSAKLNYKLDFIIEKLLKQ